MKIKFYFSLLLLLSSFDICSQTYTISGYVIDKSSGEHLSNANVYDLITKRGTTTNEYGYFSISLSSDTVNLSISFVGYSSFSSVFYLKEDVKLNIQLESNQTLGEVLIIDNKVDDIIKSTQMSIIEIPISQIKSLPVLLGEADILKSLQLMPGVKSGEEASSGLYVRGGGSDQNLILLDGVPVYNASHLFGFFSIFNPDAISSVQLIKGGFPARYGGRLSSVLDVRMKEGNLKEFHAEGSIGNVAAKLTIEGPIIKDKMSFIVSARRTYIDALVASIMKLYRGETDKSKINAGYYFYDFNAKLNYKISDKDRLFVSTYMGQDKVYTDISQEDTPSHDTVISTIRKHYTKVNWGNITTSLRWNHVFHQKLFSNITAV